MQASTEAEKFLTLNYERITMEKKNGGGGNKGEKQKKIGDP